MEKKLKIFLVKLFVIRGYVLRKLGETKRKNYEMGKKQFPSITLQHSLTTHELKKETHWHFSFP